MTEPADPIRILFVPLFVVVTTMANSTQVEIRAIPLPPGAPLTRGAAAKRWGVYQIVGAIVPVFSWVDGLWQLWDKPFQQCLHDKAAGTVVVKLTR